MMRSLPFLPLFFLLSFSLYACGDDGRSRPGRDGGGGGGPCSEGALSCRGKDVYACTSGEEVLQESCTLEQACVDGLGCRECAPDVLFCDEQEVRRCSADGMSSTLERECPASQVCSGTGCMDACSAAAANRSNIGCEYMLVDLDNEFSQGPLSGWLGGGGVPPAQEQFALVLANTAAFPVVATVYQSVGVPNAPAETVVGTFNVPANDLIRIDLDNREVDGSTTTTEGPGTMLTNHAYRVVTNFPVVAYQFNPIIESASNDASLLLPVAALDTHYRLIGWPTATPLELPGFGSEGVPDHSYVTVIGTEAGTTVSVTLGGPIIAGEIQGGGTIAAASAGETIEYTIGPYDVLNLESTGAPGDLTGTIVRSNKPVAVFSGGERAIAPLGDSVSQHPDWTDEDGRCCTEHVEEQVFPTTAWGKDFVITRSPVRTDHPTWREPDIYRVMADADGTVITTNLPGADASFTLNENEWREFSTDRSFILQASEPVSIMQMLVSQNWVHSYKPGHGGDPSMILYPPYEQYRDEYLFLVPDTFSSNYVVLSVPQSTTVYLDGGNIAGDEFMRLCEYEDAGIIDGEPYTAVTCPVEGGTHTVEATRSVGIMVYGYHSVGSYGYAGGSNLERINLR
ncbi:MAG: hypothetical protein CMN30_31520 [Sandaracinus sp.]|nr:hypothetical protein [Sandaracinus sp.]